MGKQTQSAPVATPPGAAERTEAPPARSNFAAQAELGEASECGYATGLDDGLGATCEPATKRGWERRIS